MKSFIAILGSLLLAGCGGHAPEKASADANAAPIAVQTLAVAAAAWPQVYEAVGTVRARTAAAISSKVMGHVREVKVQAGDRVRQGQLLVVLDARDLDAAEQQAEAALAEAGDAVAEVDAAIAAAKAQLELTEVTYARMNDLWGKKSISNQEWDEAQMKLKVARANHDMALSKKKQVDAKIRQAKAAAAGAEVMRGHAELAAPFDGTVTAKNVEPGDLAAPGTPLLTIEREGAFRLEAAVEESRLGTVRRGQQVEVVLDALGRTLTGRISEVVPAVDAASRSFIAKIDLPAAPDLRSGVYGRARFPLAASAVLAVPSGAVVERGQLQSVFVADHGIARARLVTLGRRSPDRVEVLSGLTPGERVIFPIPPSLADGSRVEVR